MAMLLTYGGGKGSHNFDLDINVSNVPDAAEALEKISTPVAGAHRRAKRIRQETVTQALNNRPFEEYPQAVYAWKRMREEGGAAEERFDESYTKAVERFLREVYHNLTYIPEIALRIGGNYDYDKENRALNEALYRYIDLGMQSHGESLRYAYNGLCGLRIVFDDARERGGCSVETVVPSRYLPELLMAAPVWFIKASAPSATTLERQRLSIGTRTPNFGEAVRYFCDLGLTDQFAYLFQMYNRMPKAFEQFTGSDIMPLPIC